MSNRRNIPLVKTAIAAIDTTVIKLYHESEAELLTAKIASSAKLSPITATIAPVTTGGMSFSTQAVPTALTNKPIKKYSKPHIIMPPKATPILALGVNDATL